MRAGPRDPLLRADLANLELDEAVRRRAVVPFLPAGAALCRRTAARLHGIDLRMPHERGVPLPLEVAVQIGTEPLSRSGIVAHVCDLRDDVTVLDGVPVTTLRRTLLDIARFAPRPIALAVLDRAAAAGTLEREELLEALTTMKGQRFVAQARQLIRLADAGAESPYESMCRLRIVDGGFPPPQTQVRVPRPGGRRPYRLDMAWPERRKAVEYDGVEDHDGAAARAHDEARRAYLRGEGWEVLVVGKGEVLGTAQHFEHALAGLLGLPWNGRRRSW
ncbi:type IV toxin-antitoxin system AbiEi family antitoxin [Kineococcus sp. SYSU DK003]|uniref:type IV toxin-antitoxin system AbiEi family antitoxin n=1 Tax=Kineococcus sp. SYSU DK003 TaxID=3383124 RepID=UPI003D7C7560